jgi:cation transport ATPase
MENVLDFFNEKRVNESNNQEKKDLFLKGYSVGNIVDFDAEYVKGLYTSNGYTNYIKARDSLVKNEKFEKELVLDSYHYQTGKGATAVYKQEEYYLGNRRLLGLLAQKQALRYENEYSKQGKTAVFLANQQGLLAVFAVADTLKNESFEAVAALKKKNIRVAMLTGDNENVAKAIAAQVGIDEYFAEALPKDKADAVERVRSVGGFVAMVGDGINDSPALKTADVGVAMGTGTDIAIDSADVVLSHGNVGLVDTMVALSEKTVRNIHENLFWAFFYNCVAIPIAAGMFAFAGISLNPMIGAAAMSLSSLFVVTNALRLTRFGKTKKSLKDNMANKEQTIMKKTLKIEGMMCQRCVAHVQKALSELSGVVAVEVHLKKKTAVIETETEVENEVLIEKITNAGYEVKKITL